MRRWFVMLLLTLLPLQFSWAAVAAYCGHGLDAQAQHLGHHAHQHADQAAAAPQAEAAGQAGVAGFDFDCGHCHSGCCSMPAPVGSPVPPATSAHPATPVDGHVRTRAQAPPDRPQWLRFA